LEEAREALDETLKTYRELAEKNPKTYLPDVALALNNLGILYSDQHQTEEARRAFEEALKIYEADAKQKSRTVLVRCQAGEEIARGIA